MDDEGKKTPDNDVVYADYDDGAFLVNPFRNKTMTQSRRNHFQNAVDDNGNFVDAYDGTLLRFRLIDLMELCKLRDFNCLTLDEHIIDENDKEEILQLLGDPTFMPSLTAIFLREIASESKGAIRKIMNRPTLEKFAAHARPEFTTQLTYDDVANALRSEKSVLRDLEIEGDLDDDQDFSAFADFCRAIEENKSLQSLDISLPHNLNTAEAEEQFNAKLKTNDTLLYVFLYSHGKKDAFVSPYLERNRDWQAWKNQTKTIYNPALNGMVWATLMCNADMPKPLNQELLFSVFKTWNVKP